MGFYFSDFALFAHKDSLGFFSVIEDIIRKQNLLLLLQLVWVYSQNGLYYIIR